MSIRAKFISFMIRRTMKGQFDDIRDDIEGFRNRMAGADGMASKIPSEVSIEKVVVAGINCEWVCYDGSDAHRVLMYLHGGGYVFGGLDSHRDIAWRLSQESGMKVLNVDYRLAPENLFPAALDDATACYRWLLDEGYKASQIAIGGDSAGGGLTLATMVHLKSLGVELPAGAILISPWLDLTASGDSVTSNDKADPMLSGGALKSFADMYLGKLDKKAPLASPLFADLSNLPAMLIHVGSTEVLLSDSTRLVEKTKEAGGDAVLEIWPKMPHVFQVFAARIPEGKEAIKKFGEFLKNRTSAA
ncbi:MAG: alpha/beta hydrolase [Pseudomonadales bacterium]|jgi:acetyl esterase/lipase